MIATTNALPAFGYSLDTVAYCDKQPFTLSFTPKVDRIAGSSVVTLWAEGGLPGEKPHRHGKNVHTAQKKDPWPHERFRTAGALTALLGRSH